MNDELDLYWVIPGVLGGTSMPWIHPRRHHREMPARDAFEDELPLFWIAGVRAFVCLMDLPGVVRHYQTAGFEALLAPIPDGGVPTLEEFRAIMDFIEDQRAKGNPVAVHCAAGLGRTGTILVGYLMLQGASFDDALAAVREVRPGAVETGEQIQFLHQLGRDLA